MISQLVPKLKGTTTKDQSAIFTLFRLEFKRRCRTDSYVNVASVSRIRHSKFILVLLQLNFDISSNEGNEAVYASRCGCHLFTENKNCHLHEKAQDKNTSLFRSRCGMAWQKKTTNQTFSFLAENVIRQLQQQSIRRTFLHKQSPEFFPRFIFKLPLFTHYNSRISAKKRRIDCVYCCLTPSDCKKHLFFFLKTK